MSEFFTKDDFAYPEHMKPGAGAISRTQMAELANGKLNVFLAARSFGSLEDLYAKSYTYFKALNMALICLRADAPIISVLQMFVSGEISISAAEQALADIETERNRDPNAKMYGVGP